MKTKEQCCEEASFKSLAESSTETRQDVVHRAMEIYANQFKQPEIVSLRESVLWFAIEMEKKLKANDHKGGWRNCTLQYLSMRLTQERKELYDAIENRRGSFFGDSHTDEEIIKECADIANYALMIADGFGKNYGK